MLLEQMVGTDDVVLVRQMPEWGRCFGADVPVHSGDIDLFSALRGCNRSGDNARRSNGELGSALLGRAKPFFDAPLIFIVDWPLGNVVNTPGLYDCVVLLDPGWWPTGKANGDGERVGDDGSGDGDGVRANGDNLPGRWVKINWNKNLMINYGMCPTDLRRFGPELLVVVCNPLLLETPVVWSLCLRPCSVDGRWYNCALPDPVGVFGADEDGDDDCEVDDVDWRLKVSNGDRLKRFNWFPNWLADTFESWFRVNDWNDRLGVTIVGDDNPDAAANCCISALARFVLIRRNNDVFLFLSLSLRCFFCRLTPFRANLLCNRSCRGDRWKIVHSVKFHKICKKKKFLPSCVHHFECWFDLTVWILVLHVQLH